MFVQLNISAVSRPEYLKFLIRIQIWISYLQSRVSAHLRAVSYLPSHVSAHLRARYPRHRCAKAAVHLWSLPRELMHSFFPALDSKPKAVSCWHGK